MPFIIYRHVNKLNGKSYVGCVVSHKGIRSRWLRHVSDSKKNSSSIFHRAIALYGDGDDVWDHFSLCEVETLEEAKEQEKYWISVYRSNGLKEGGAGYNMTDGGDGVEGYKHTEEAKRFISELHKGKSKSEETKKKMSRPKSPEHKAKLQEILKAARAKFAEERRRA